tara:strand:- start:2357 stop:2812 length:456 start_codon:yes stop_codon:yes gene_type:complete
MSYKSKKNTNSGKFLLIAITVIVSIWITANLSSNNIETTSNLDLKSNSIDYHLVSKNNTNTEEEVFIEKINLNKIETVDEFINDFTQNINHTNNIDWSLAPSVNSLERKEFYDKHNLAYDETIMKIEDNNPKINLPKNDESLIAKDDRINK